jgi:type II secretory pathway pseudopilin PulG
MKIIIMKIKNSHGFAIIEILIAITILSIVMLGIISGVSAGIVAITGNKNSTKAMIIAKNKLNEFLLLKKRGTDIQEETVKEYPGYSYSRKITRYEHPMFGPLDAKRVEILVLWEERGKKKNYSISYIYPER